MNVKEILTRQPPDVLYHYTTQTGLLGIVMSREIWASHTQYLNDVREFRHAIEITSEELSAMELEPQPKDKVELLKEMKEGLKGIESINVCVCLSRPTETFCRSGGIIAVGRLGFRSDSLGLSCGR